MGRQSNEVLPATAVFVVSFAVYIKCLHPSLAGGDSGELIVAAHESGVAHPPGYPLFTALAKLFIRGLPWGSVAWRVNFFSAFCGAMSGRLIYLLVHRLTASRGSSLLGACTFVFSRLTWTWSVSAEVFSLNNMLLTAMMLVAVQFEAADKKAAVKLCVGGSLLCGLCLSNQHTSVVYVAAIVPWALCQLVKHQLLTLPVVVKLTCSFLCGLLPYIYLPLSSHLNMARWTWGDQRSVQGFLVHLLRVEYGTWDLLKGHTSQDFWAGLLSYVTHLLSDLSLMVAVLALISIIPICLRYKKNGSSVLVVFYIMLVAYLVFFCWRANLDIENPLFFRVVERFWMQSDLVVVILASVTFSDICRFLCQAWRLDWLGLDVMVALPLIVSRLTSQHLWSTCDFSSNFVVHDFAVQTLEAFPADSIILTKGDLPSNSFRYFHFCENVRPDLTIFDQEVLTYDWSLPMTRVFYPGITFPGDLLQLYSGVRADKKVAFRFQDLLDANYNSRPIFACIGVQDHELSWEENYTLWPFGICFKIIRKSTPLDVGRWTNTTSNLADQWKYPWSSANNGSWEDVANSEMWRAKTSTAYFYLELAISKPEDQKEAIDLLMESYQLFTKAIEKEKSFPPYWHRNYAIVCERLLRASTGLSHRMLVEKTIHHFKEYVNNEPDNDDSPSIMTAVASLEAYMAKLKMADLAAEQKAGNKYL